jgi:hypothetical protein
MKRLLTCAALGAAILTGTGTEVSGQGMGERRTGRFDLGVYAGGSWTSDWFQSRFVTSTGGAITEEPGGQGFRIGAGPIFGAAATFWTSPAFGVRLHGAYFPSGLPVAAGGTGTTGSPQQTGQATGFFATGPRPLNNYLYDLNLVLRPWVTRTTMAPVLASTYLFVGGGGMTTNLAGEGSLCEPTLLARGACLSRSPSRASVGQGTAGLGVDLFPLAGALGLFAELAAHGYSSPVHVGDGWVPRAVVPRGGRVAIADNRFAVTTRGVVGLKLAFGDLVPVVAPVPVSPAPMPAPAAPPPAAPATREITVCVVEDGQLRTVTATFNPATSDTMIAGQRFTQRYPAQAPMYAAGQSWMIQQQPVTFQNREYVPFGVTRVIQPPQLQRVGEFQGTAVFAETGAATPHQVVYVPVRPGCEFQPYQLRAAIRPRG